MTPQQIKAVVQVINTCARTRELKLSRKLMEALAAGVIASHSKKLPDIREALVLLHKAAPDGDIPGGVTRKANEAWVYKEDKQLLVLAVSDDAMRALLQYQLYQNHFRAPQARAIYAAAIEVLNNPTTTKPKVK